MSSLKPITIVGGGLAGLTLGIALRRHHVPITIWEAGDYPRHRVCGEFVSGKGQATLRRLGLAQLFERAGAVFAQNARFFMGPAATPLHGLNPPALCLSRYTMDCVLAQEVQALGGDLRTNARWQNEPNQEGVIRASGRRVQSLERGWRWFGLKVHAQGVRLAADLEMHACDNGYVGLCRLPGGETNVCGLFRARPKTHWSNPVDLLRGQPGTSLNGRLAEAEFDMSSFCSIAGLPMLPRRAAGRLDCPIGDALTMIPPVTGNGMSMAFEAAEIALEPVLAYVRGEIPWDLMRESILRACDSTFQRRLFWAARLQSVMFSSLLSQMPGALLLRSAWLWRAIFVQTR